MLGWIVLEADGPRRPQLTLQPVAGTEVALLRAAPPRHFIQRRRLERALGAMAAAGVRLAAVEGTLDGAMTERFALRRSEVWPLRRALLPQLLDWAQREWDIGLDRATVLLSTVHADRAAYEAAALLAQRARYVAVRAAWGRQALEEAVLRRWGLGPGDEARAVLEVCVDGERQGKGPLLHVGRGCQRVQTLRAETAEGAEWPETVLAALFQAGKLKTGEIRLKSVEFCP